MDKPLPAGWRRVRLGEVTTIIMGQSPPGNTYRKVPNEGIPFFQGKADFGIRHPVAHTWCTEPTRIAEPGDILLSVRAPVGPTNVADTLCCIGRGLAAIRPSSIIDMDFLLFSLKHLEQKLTQKGKGSTFEAIRKVDLIYFEIPLPPLDEQRRIVAILNEKMAAVQQARRAAEEQLRAVQALPAAYLRQAFPQPGQPLPAGWRRVRLGEVCCADRVIIDPTSPDANNLPFLGLEHIESETGIILLDPEDLPHTALSTTFLFDTRHVLYGKLRPYLNKVAIPNFSGKCSTEIVPLYPINVERYYLAWFLRRQETVSEAMKQKTGSRMPRADLRELFNLSIPLPPLDEQQRIVAILNEKMAAVQQARRAAEEQLRAVQALPAAYLRQAFAGEL